MPVLLRYSLIGNKGSSEREDKSYDRYERRHLFVPALFLGAVSTALYAVTLGFWPLLIARLVWGLAWVGIWIGGNTIILDISDEHNRGRWVGIYQVFFFLGASGGSILGGFLTDWLGYHQAMGIGATLTLLGAIIALLLLPETRNFKVGENALKATVSKATVLKATVSDDGSLATKQEIISGP